MITTENAEVKKMKEDQVLFKGEMIRAILARLKTQTRRIITRRNSLLDGGPCHKEAWDNLDFDNAWVDDGPSPAGNEGPYLKVPSLSGDTVHRVYSRWQVGDLLWVRETWRVGAWDENNGRICVDYKADNYARQEWLTVPDNEMFQRLWIQTSEDAAKAGVKYDSDGQYHWKPGDSPARWRSPIHMPRWACRLILKVTAVHVERLQDICGFDALAEGITIHPDVRSDEVMCRSEFRNLWDSINAKRDFSWESNPWVRATTFEVTNGTPGCDCEGVEATVTLS